MLIYDRIRMLCKERGVTITGTEMELGFARGSLCKIDKNKPSAERLQKLAEYFEVESDWLTGASEYKTKKEMLQHFDDISDIPALRSEIFRLERGTQIPVLGEVAAGQPIFAEEKYIDYEEISEKMAKSGDFFGLKIKGNSMSPRISEGDTVIVRQQDDAESGDVVIVLINGETATCKRLMKYAEGITLLSFNPAYDPITFSNQEILEKPVKIIGKVVENRQKY